MLLYLIQHLQKIDSMALKSHFLLFVVLAALSGSTACVPEYSHRVSGGKGGHVVLMMTPFYYSRKLSNGKAYLKYAASFAPKDGIYDDSTNFVTIDSIPYAIFSGLSTGDYYVKINAYDSISSRNLSGQSMYIYITKDDTAKEVVSMEPI